MAKQKKISETETLAKNAKESFIAEMEELILMNLLLPGERLPPERDLAKQREVSRPLIHEALLELEARGLISIRPRHGCIVNNYKQDGSLNLLNSLYRFSASPMAKKIDTGLEELRRLVLIESLKKCFAGGPQTVKSLADHLEQFVLVSKKASLKVLTEQDFLFYRYIIEAGGNIVFMLLFNSARCLYHQKLEAFFKRRPEAAEQAQAMKLSLINSIREGKKNEALELIRRMSSYSTYGET